MPRLVTKTAKTPTKIGEHNICMCGLSEEQPLCDKSHLLTKGEDETKMYWYKDGVAEEVITESSGSEHCDGDGGCGHCQH